VTTDANLLQLATDIVLDDGLVLPFRKLEGKESIWDCGIGSIALLPMAHAVYQPRWGLPSTAVVANFLDFAALRVPTSIHADLELRSHESVSHSGNSESREHPSCFMLNTVFPIVIRLLKTTLALYTEPSPPRDRKTRRPKAAGPADIG